MAAKDKTISLAAAKPFNEHRKGMFVRAGNAGAAVTVDTRLRPVRAQKGKGSYDRSKRGGRDFG